MDWSREALYGREPEQPWRDTMQVCLDGHVITDEARYSPELTRARCPKDGVRTIMECPSCNKPIPGEMHYPNVVGFSGVNKEPPEYCEVCGEPYPWTTTRAAAAKAKADKDAATAKAAAAAEKPTEGDFLQRIFERFDDVAKQLRQRYGGRSTVDIHDEYDVQDLLHALLRIYFDDIRNEEWTPSYGGKSGRMDFLLKSEQCVIETKMARKGLTHKELGDELIIDIDRYKAHPDCKELWCFVYDPSGYVRNPRGIEADLSGKRGALSVRVIIRS